MPERFHPRPLPGLEATEAQPSHRLAEVADGLSISQFAELLDPLVQSVLREGFDTAGANEGTVWLVDAAQDFLEPAWNSGPHAPAMVGRFKQPLSEGLISMAFATEQSFVENDVQRNVRQSKWLDSWLQVHTRALIVVPLQWAGACRGVISCVQLQPAATSGGNPSGFSPQSLARVETTTALVARLVEHQLLRRIMGLES